MNTFLHPHLRNCCWKPSSGMLLLLLLLLLSMMILIIFFTCPPTIHFKLIEVRQVLLQSATAYFITKCDRTRAPLFLAPFTFQKRLCQSNGDRLKPHICYICKVDREKKKLVKIKKWSFLSHYNVLVFGSSCFQVRKEKLEAKDVIKFRRTRNQVWRRHFAYVRYL